MYVANKHVVIGRGGLEYKYTTKMRGRNNYSVGMRERGGKDTLFRECFTDMSFELGLGDEGI